MKAVIMAGGEGKRLRPYTSIFPKPLLPIGEKPILEILLEKLKESGINEVILATNYKSSLLEMFFGNGEKFGMKISYSKETMPLGTVGPLKIITDKLDEDFIVMNGDILTDINIKDLIDFHQKNKSDLTVVTKKHKILLDYGMVKTNESDVIGWEEKPELNAEISTGIYILNPAVLFHIPDNQKFDMPDLVRKIIENKGKVSRFLYDGRWIDIGRVEDFEKAQNEMLQQFEGKESERDLK